MTQMNINYLTNPQVNSGNTINLLGSKIGFTWDIFTNAPDTPSTSVTASYDSRLGKGIYTGFKNPDITISGTFKINESHTSGTGATIDYEHIKDLGLRADQICTLRSDMFETTANSTGDINVMLVNVSLDNTNTNVVNYTLTFIEIRSDS